MPAAAVASFTPAMSGMAGAAVGASGETEVDMGFPAVREQEAALCIIFVGSRGEAGPKMRKPGEECHPASLFVWSAPDPIRRDPGFASSTRPGMTSSVLRRRRHLGHFFAGGAIL